MPITARTLALIAIGSWIVTIALMFIVTTQLRNNFNERESFFGKLNGEELSIDTVAMAYVQYDVLAAESLYRKIWTYDALIFLSGIIVLKLLRER